MRSISAPIIATSSAAATRGEEQEAVLARNARCSAVIVGPRGKRGTSSMAVSISYHRAARVTRLAAVAAAGVLC